MTPVPSVTAALRRFEQNRSVLPGAWLQEQRTRAIADFAAAGFPDRRTEAWKYTNLSRLARTDFGLPVATPVDQDVWRSHAVEGAYRIVVVNGRFDPAASALPEPGSDVLVQPLSEAVERSRELFEEFLQQDGAPLLSLNTAFMQEGLVLHVPDGTEVAEPIQIVHVSTGSENPVANHPRSLVSLGHGSRAIVLETYAGSGRGQSWTNCVNEFRIGPGSELVHAKLQQEAPTAYHTSTARIDLERDARYRSFAITTGAALSRNETKISCKGSGAVCDIRGGLLLQGRQHGDNTIRIDHKVAGTTGRQVFRNVLHDAARSVFQGRIDVCHNAQKTDSSQSCRSLLLSTAARADTKPELRILADDVRCAHGATVGELDRDALFYLQSRGIPASQARALLIEAFVAEIIEEVPVEAVRNRMAEAISGWTAVEASP